MVHQKAANPAAAININDTMIVDFGNRLYAVFFHDGSLVRGRI